MVALLTADSYTYFSSVFSPQWGLFLNGAAVITADSVVDMSFKRDWNISDYPLEKGAFESYNKVSVPYDVRLRFSAGGSQSQRQALLTSIAAIAGTLTLYDAVTPEAVYSNVNVKHYDYRRTSINGVGLIVVDVWCEEIRVTTSGSFANTQAPSGAGQVNDGTVQTTPPSATQAGAVWT